MAASKRSTFKRLSTKLGASLHRETIDPDQFFGTLLVISEGNDLKTSFIAAVKEPTADEETAKCTGALCSKDFLRNTNNNDNETIKKQTKKQSMLKRLSTLGREPPRDIRVTFDITDTPYSLINSSPLTFNVNVSSADGVLYFPPDINSIQSIEDMRPLLRNENVLIVVVSNHGNEAKELCEMIANVRFCDVTSFYKTMTESEQRSQLLLGKLKKHLFDAMQEYLKNESESENEALQYDW